MYRISKEEKKSKEESMIKINKVENTVNKLSIFEIDYTIGNQTLNMIYVYVLDNNT